jgi:uncharacterized YccA/Bax inhibitor family protein
MMRTANPALNNKTFQNVGSVSQADAMTINGTVNKTGIMLLLLIAAASYTWSRIDDDVDDDRNCGRVSYRPRHRL